MTDRKELKIKSGGQWLISPVNDTKVFCRETFTEDQQDIDAMVQEFARDRILPNAEAIDKLDKELSLGLLREMGELGLIGVDTPEEYGGTELDKITSCIVMEGMARGGSHHFLAPFLFRQELEVWELFSTEPLHKKKNIFPK